MSLDTLETLMAASLVLLLGRLILARTPILRTYSIPEPVIGRTSCSAIGVCACASTLKIDVRFDTALQVPLMLTFFASIGLNADLAGLKAGGRALIVFLGAVVGLLVMQNVLGIGLAWALGQERILGLLGASVTLSGGHGTGAAWAKVFAERHGLQAGNGDRDCLRHVRLDTRRIDRRPGRTLPHHALCPRPQPRSRFRVGMTGFEQPKAVRPITADAVIETVALIAVCLAVGSALASWLRGTAFELPVRSFVYCRSLASRFLRQRARWKSGWYQVLENATALLGNVSLGLFLAIALMSLRLGDLATLRTSASCNLS